MTDGIIHVSVTQFHLLLLHPVTSSQTGGTLKVQRESAERVSARENLVIKDGTAKMSTVDWMYIRSGSFGTRIWNKDADDTDL